MNLELEVGARVFMGWAEKAGGVYSGVLRVGRRWGTETEFSRWKVKILGAMAALRIERCGRR